MKGWVVTGTLHFNRKRNKKNSLIVLTFFTYFKLIHQRWIVHARCVESEELAQWEISLVLKIGRAHV